MPKFPSPSLLRKPQTRLITVEDPGHLGFDYKIRLSKRKSAAIEVRSGKVVVAAPHRVAQRDLKQWVNEKAAWIRDKLQQQAEREDEIPERQFVDGEAWPWLGESLTLRLVSGPKLLCERHDGHLQIALPKRITSNPDKPITTAVQKALQSWYQQQAQSLLEAKTQAVCQQLQKNFPQAQYQKVQLRRTKSKWGHCTRQGVIQYNWLIVQAPEWIVDYLVVHECCHLVHHNHSRHYWNLVANLNPDYDSARRWLHQHGHTLVV
ncbi:M48 family metallopeptidase [Pseudomaricurvus sp.]|uniref:M48 family metallopeptidase n=1 Tax=Pseudomaricurvus sp. TaxID=2004510 RepID=UPI003F6ABB74